MVNELSDMLSSGISRNIRFEIGTRSYEDLIEKYGNYITKLSDLVIISKTIKLFINNQEYEEKVDSLYIPVEKLNIDKPVLEKKQIKMFNLEQFVRLKKENFGNQFETELSNEPTKIDNLIKEIDKKLEQLDIEEKIHEAEKLNVCKSSFQQFRI